MSGLHLDIRLSRAEKGLVVETTVPDGITAVCGASGSGKTTLLRCIAGLEPRATGSVQVGGVPWLGAAGAVPAHRRGVGFCFQDSRVLPHLSVRGNLRYGTWFDWLRPGRRDSVIGVAEVIERLELGPLLHRRGRSLSGGEARRVALGRALLSARTLLLLDEPFVGLEDGMRRAACALIGDFYARSGIPVLAVTHHPRQMLDLTETVLLVEEGRCRACGSVTDLLKTPECFATAIRIGLPNVLSTRVRWQDPHRRETLCQVVAHQDGAARMRHPVFRANYNGEAEGMHVRFALAPDDVALCRAPAVPTAEENLLGGRVATVSPGEERTHYLIDGGVRLMVARVNGDATGCSLQPGDPVWCSFRRDQLERLAS